MALDGVLRGNNYCAHNDLAHRLKIAPKELRVTLVKMAHARLVKCEKRVQKRINFRDERRPSRSVNTEFWFVPLREVVDAFTFRVHMISAELDRVLRSTQPSDATFVSAAERYIMKSTSCN